ncbi:MAG: ABC transporter ATP-binding protein, partial [Promethearchaeota archaeon]
MGMYRGLFSEKRKRSYSDSELLTRYLRRLVPFKKSIVLISLFILISTTADIILPLIVGFAVEEIEKPKQNFSLILGAGMVYLLLSIIIFVMFSLHRREIGNFVPFFLENLRMDTFDKLQEQDMSFFDKHLSGSLNSRVSNDAMDFGNTTILLANTMGNLLLSVVTFTILLWLDPILALITLSAIPFLFLLMFSLRRLARIVSLKYRKSIGNVNSAMIESIEGIQVCKSFGQESIVSAQFNEINKDYFRTAFHLTAVTHSWRAILESITASVLIIIIYLGVQGKTDTATMLVFILYVQRFFRPIMVLATFVPDISAGMAAYERILDILDAEPNVKQNPRTSDVSELEGEIIFTDVDFAYREPNWIFKGFNLRIKKGEKLAVVGHTGAGKSSLVKLLARYYEFQGGSIKIDGTDIRDLKLDSYRRNLGMVQQDVFLFSGTIEENIRYGRREASEEDLWKAIRAVHADELIEYLPEGLQTQVGERGRGLSAGQRQLISFARALLI